MNHPMRRPVSFIMSVLICVCLSGCIFRPYRFTITQGNEICADSVAQLQIGMSAEEVHYIMGTPMLQDTFHENRWDYVFTNTPGYEPTERYHVAIFFQDGRVTQIREDQIPQIS